MEPLNLVKLTELMEMTRGRAGVGIGLIDGPIAKNHPGLQGARMQELRPEHTTCCLTRSAACRHGTFVAGMLCGRRDAGALSICPGCTLLARPIFGVSDPAGEMPTAEPEELAAAISDCITAGATVLNLSVSVTFVSSEGEKALEKALNYSADKSVLVLAAAGNEGTICSSVITHHPWVIPVTACDQAGKPISTANFGPSLGRRGLSAPGDHITSLGPNGNTLTLSGTSFAVPFVTGSVALLWSAFPKASAAEIKMALVSRVGRTIVPPLLDVAAAYHTMSANRMRMSA